MHALELTENETQFVKKLRKISPQRQISLVQMIDQFLEPEDVRSNVFQENEYLNDPIWQLIGSASSGIKGDDSALNHDSYLY